MKWLVAMLVLAGCGGPTSVREVSHLRIVAEPQVARVYIDDHFAGTGRVLSRRPAELLPGVHFVTISAPSYFPHDFRLDLPDGETTLRIALRPIPR